MDTRALGAERSRRESTCESSANGHGDRHCEPSPLSRPEVVRKETLEDRYYARRTYPLDEVRFDLEALVTARTPSCGCAGPSAQRLHHLARPPTRRHCRRDLAVVARSKVLRGRPYSSPRQSLTLPGDRSLSPPQRSDIGSGPLPGHMRADSSSASATGRSVFEPRHARDGVLSPRASDRARLVSFEPTCRGGCRRGLPCAALARTVLPAAGLGVD